MQSEQQWQTVLARDPAQDGRFVFAVRTTGVYCRPSCPSRRPRRESVEFYPTPQDAERAGYRACLRCKPTSISEQAQYVIRARQLLDASEGVMTLSQLSAAVGVSSFHLQRLFKRATGVSPREYQAARRMLQVKQELRNGKDVTTALYDAGFSSSSRLYETTSHNMGMTPAAYRGGGSRSHVQYVVTDSPLGKLLVAATARGICAIRFGDSEGELESELRREFHAASISRNEAAVRSYVDAVLAMVQGQRPAIDIPLDVLATAFQGKVWELLKRIPSGETRTYTDIAREMGQPQAVRAVARACASNPVALVVPCHRVIRSNGELAGYRWGLQRKKKLLELERARTK